jgi:hypothetical protein
MIAALCGPGGAMRPPLRRPLAPSVSLKAGKMTMRVIQRLVAS